ncbi:50S ribosomal protein L18 [Methanobrevibacter sp. DSM 116169]|uniref:50S ribosomal protein L18 n=1 Tax=Methanobrevibacter sp. DSM 116169 TaxID=3242727 RepID=UPI0038FCA829
MAQGTKYKVAFRRRREGKTNYAARIKLVDHDKPRLVVRLSNSYVNVQIIMYKKDGDETIVSANSKELIDLGWLGGLKNTSAAYLTAYLCGKKAIANDIDNAILDVGLKSPIKGSKIFAALKGAIDAGLEIPHGESVLPSDDRITGEHIANYAESLSEDEVKKLFSKYLEKGLQPVDLPKNFDETKNKIDETGV